MKQNLIFYRTCVICITEDFTWVEKSWEVIVMVLYALQSKHLHNQPRNNIVLRCRLLQPLRKSNIHNQHRYTRNHHCKQFQPWEKQKYNNQQRRKRHEFHNIVHVCVQRALE